MFCLWMDVELSAITVDECDSYSSMSHQTHTTHTLTGASRAFMYPIVSPFIQLNIPDPYVKHNNMSQSPESAFRSEMSSLGALIIGALAFILPPKNRSHPVIESTTSFHCNRMKDGRERETVPTLQSITDDNNRPPSYNIMGAPI